MDQFHEMMGLTFDLFPEARVVCFPDDCCMTLADHPLSSWRFLNSTGRVLSTSMMSYNGVIIKRNCNFWRDKVKSCGIRRECEGARVAKCTSINCDHSQYLRPPRSTKQARICDDVLLSDLK